MVRPLRLQAASWGSGRHGPRVRLGYYEKIVNGQVPRCAVGIGVFPFATHNGTWPSTPASVAQRVQRMLADRVPELFVFRIYTESSPQWPWPMWWPYIDKFAASSSPLHA